MNVQLREITVTARDGRVSQLDQVYIRGSHVRFFIVPDMLKNAPMFKKIGPNAMKGRGIGMGRGKATVARAQGMHDLNEYFYWIIFDLYIWHKFFYLARGGRARGFRGGPRGRGRPQ